MFENWEFYGAGTMRPRSHHDTRKARGGTFDWRGDQLHFGSGFYGIYSCPGICPLLNCESDDEAEVEETACVAVVFFARASSR